MGSESSLTPLTECRPENSTRIAYGSGRRLRSQQRSGQTRRPARTGGSFCHLVRRQKWHFVHSGLAPGDVVHVRGRSWILQSLTPHTDCAELELEPADDVDGHTAPYDAHVVLLTPFDRPAKLAAARPVRVVTRRAWFGALRHAILSQREPGSLVAPAQAIVDLLPHQLEPALAVMRHGIGRLLLADAVGLGKTIEAGLVLAELRARGGLDRALVLTPPGLRDQWSAELRDRFAIDAVVADAAWLRACPAPSTHGPFRACSSPPSIS